MATPQLVCWLVLGVALVISVVTDVLSRRIYDAVTYPAVLAGLSIRWVAEGPGTFTSGFLSGALGAAVMLAIFGVLAWRQRMGWGDVKLAAAAGACLGLELGVAAALFISLAGALQAVLALLWQGALLDTLQGAARRFAERVRLLEPGGAPAAARRIPYGVAIALGSFWAMWWDRAMLMPR